MKRVAYIILYFIILTSCDESSSIKIENKLSKAIIRNIEWGGIPISSQILPGETSSKITIRDDSYYEIDLPATYPLKFYIDLNGDKVYVQTKVSYKLGKEDDITIVVGDTTSVFNPLLEYNN